MRRAAAALSLAAGAFGPAGAAVETATPDHFAVVHAAEVGRPGAEVYALLAQPGRWWSPKHTWSGDASNLALDPVAGGCWCERWGAGASAQHARVLKVLPGRQIVLQAALGPLLSMPVQGVLTLSADEKDGRTTLRIAYEVGGPAALKLDQIAPAVDRVLGEQFARLKSTLETGKPE